MKRIYIIALTLLLMLIPLAVNADPMTTTEKNLYIGYVFLTLIDWGQTHYIADHPDTYYEMNPILGEHPSREEVDRYFFFCILTNTLIPYTLEHNNIVSGKYIRFYQVLATSTELWCVGNNYYLKIKVSY